MSDWTRTDDPDEIGRLHAERLAAGRELMEAERALRQSEYRIRQLLDNMRSGVAVYKAMDGGADFVFLDFNRAGERIENVRREDVVGRRVTEVFPGVRDMGLLDVLGRVYRTGVPERHPVSFYTDTHTRGWRENYVYRLPTGEVVAVYDDVTDAKRTEEALRSSERRMFSILNSVYNGVIAADAEGFVSFINPAAQALTGWGPAAVGRPLNRIFRILDDVTLELIEYEIPRIMLDSRFVPPWAPVRLVTRRGRGGLRTVLHSFAPMLDAEGKPLGIVVIFQDLTEIRFMEARLRQHQKLEAIGTLASGVAHEINNPINIIMNYAELILEDAAAGGPAADATRKILDEGRRIAGIVQNLLTFARGEPESHKPVAIPDILAATLSLMERLLIKDRIAVDVRVEPGVPLVLGRAQQLQQVLMNLLTNARDALNERFPGEAPDKVIRVRVQKVERAGDSLVRTTVEDRGAGIPASIRDRVFDPFFTTKPRLQGTGLGLSISFGIVRDHRGELWLDARDNEYTRFHMDLKPAPA